jgi:hypothetical protein
MASHFRKNTFQKECIDEELKLESLRKKQEYQKILLDQIEEQKNRKLREKEETKKREKEQDERMAREYEDMNQKMQQRLKMQQQRNLPATVDKQEPPQATILPQVVPVSDARKSFSKDAHNLNEPLRKPAKRDNQSLNPHPEKSSNLFKYNADPRVPLQEHNQNQYSGNQSSNAFLARSSHFKKIQPKEHVQVQIEEYINRQMNNIHSLGTSSQNFINTSLSKNYIMKHKDIKDYTTLMHTGDSVKPPFHYKNHSKFYGSQLVASDTIKPSQTNLHISSLQKELKNLTEQAIRATKERDIKHLEFLRLKTEFQRMQNDEFQKQNSVKATLLEAKTAEQENSLLRSYMSSNKSIQLDCDTRYMPIEEGCLSVHDPLNINNIYSVTGQAFHPVANQNFKKHITEKKMQERELVADRKLGKGRSPEKNHLDTLFPTQKLPINKAIQL